MKKFIVFVSVYLLFLSIPMNNEVKAGSGVVKYQIYMDSNSENALEVKEQTIAILDYLCDGVAQDSYITMVNSNLSLFEKIKDSTIKWKNSVLMIKIGNGKGTYINGEYEKSKVCLEEVKPKSKIMEWLGME